jgi:hypothetical protein
MNKQTKNVVRLALACFIILLIPVTIYGQHKDFAPPMLPKDPPQKTPVGGIAVLAAAGGAYAIKKLRDKNKD